MTDLRITCLRRWLRPDRGSMAVEFVVAAPILMLLMLLVSAGGQWLNLAGQVGSAARDAVRAASLARTYADAQNDAQAAAVADLGSVCAGGPTVTLELKQGGVPVGPGDFPTAQDITASVTCPASLEAFSVVDLHPTEIFGDTAAAPLDPFEDRST